MKTKILYIIPIIILCFALYLHFVPAAPKCSDEYPDTALGSERYQRDFDIWTKNFYTKHPDAGILEWSETRYQFWVENNCTESIKAYEEAKAGKGDPATMEKVEDIIKENLN